MDTEGWIAYHFCVVKYSYCNFFKSHENAKITLSSWSMQNKQWGQFVPQALPTPELQFPLDYGTHYFGYIFHMTLSS